MNTILVPTDFSKHSEKALEFAIEIAKHTNARIIVAHAYNIPVFDANIPPSMLEEMCEEEKDVIENKLQKICREIFDTRANDGKRLRADFVAEFNVPISEISRLSKEKNSDLIIMGTEGEEHFYLSLGSTTVDVLNRVTCPVLVVKENSTFKEFKKIYFALEDVKRDLPTLKQLIPLAKIFKSEIRVLHINKYADTIEELGSVKLEKKEEDDILYAIKEVIDYYNISIKFCFADQTMEGINKAIENGQPDLLALLKLQRNWLENIFHKSIIKSVIKKADLPLIILHKENQ